jgi:disulfide bond formation protein DsbB
MNSRRTSAPPQKTFRFIFLVSAGLVGGGVAMAEFLRLAACPLCILQRMLYLLLAALALLALLLGGLPVLRRPLAFFMAAAAGTGAFVAGYQVYIQRFAPATTCTGQLSWWEELVDWAGEMAPLLFKVSGLCSDPAWKFLSLSIADWSLGFFVLLTGVALYTLFASDAKRRRAG